MQNVRDLETDANTLNLNELLLCLAWKPVFEGITKLLCKIP
jgi:hypothetical protein